MIFSRRLSGIQSHIFTLLFILFGILLVEEQVTVVGVIYIPWFMGVLLFAGNGTVGWHLVQRREQPRLVHLYFAVQTALLIVMILLESPLMSYSPAATVLAIPLIAQSSVLDARGRRLVFGTVLLAVLVTSGLKAPDNVPLPAFLFPLLVSISATLYLILYFASLIVREERALQTNVKLDGEKRALAAYAAQAEELATLRERNRLAREIHDNLGHYLTAVNIQLEAARAVLENDPSRADAALGKAQSLTKEGLAEIRRSIHALRASPIENRALHEAIQMLVEEHRAAGHTIGYEVKGDIHPCSAAAEMTLYRVAQEGLTNIRKHAGAQRADLTLDYTNPARVCLELRDDGVGSNVGVGGFGLLGIRERLQLLNGTLHIRTAAGEGFTLQVELPI